MCDTKKFFLKTQKSTRIIKKNYFFLSKRDYFVLRIHVINKTNFDRNIAYDCIKTSLCMWELSDEETISEYLLIRRKYRTKMRLRFERLCIINHAPLQKLLFI